MTKHQVAQDKQIQKKRSESKSVEVGPTYSQAELAGYVKPPGIADDNTIQVQATRLGDPRLQYTQRQVLATQIGRVQGNRHLQQVVDLIQRDDDSNSEGNSGSGSSGGAGSVQHATEQFYNVSGATLDQVSPQLHHFDGQYGAQTETQLGLSGQVTPERQEDGSYRVEVEWAINSATVGLPRWTDYNQACAAAQAEWDRFLRQTRQHEQTAHVDAARTFVRDLGEADTVITGASREELVRNLQAKQQELAGRLEAIHDACDHGASIDAILHPDNGRCEDDSS